MPGKGKTALGECAVCDAGKGAKYRCPACRTPYCSLACFKTHKAGDGCATAAKMAAATGKRKRAAKTETGGKKSKSVKLVGATMLIVGWSVAAKAAVVIEVLVSGLGSGMRSVPHAAISVAQMPAAMQIRSRLLPFIVSCPHRCRE